MNFKSLCLPAMIAIASPTINLRADLTTGLVGYWPLNSSSGGVASANGYGNSGTLVNYAGNHGTWVPGQVGGALNFNSSLSQYVAIPEFSFPASAFTVSAWVNPTSSALWGTIAQSWNGYYGPFSFSNFGTDGKMSVYFAQPGSQSINVNYAVENAAPLSLNTWYLMTLVNTGNSMLIYRDGQLTGGVGYSGSLVPPPNSELDIGGDPAYGSGDGFWNGDIQDVALWNRALSPSEIESIYVRGLAGEPLLEIPEAGSSFYFTLGMVSLFGCGANFRKNAARPPG